jgi:hypothetical protein
VGIRRPQKGRLFALFLLSHVKTKTQQVEVPLRIDETQPVK